MKRDSDVQKTRRRSAVRALINRAVEVLHPEDWPIAVEMDLLRLRDRMARQDVYAVEPYVPPVEVARVAAEIRSEHMTAKLLEEGGDDA